MDWKENLDERIKEILVFDAPMSNYTTYKTGGAAQVLALPETEEQILYLKNFAKTQGLDFRIIGFGSNILVSDLGLKGIICCLKNYSGLTLNGNELTAKAGTALDEAARFSSENGLGGIECLSGIPGSCGGAVFMNAGAFGQETFDCLKSFKALTPRNEIKEISKNEVQYGYRKVKNIEGCIILSVTWALADKNPNELKQIRSSILERRSQKQPLEYPSAGSVFKRPQNDYASRLIDSCGLRGLTVGGAQVSRKHAGFIINYEKASASDIYNLIRKVQKEVYARTGVKLETEQILWGEFPPQEDERSTSLS